MASALAAEGKGTKAAIIRNLLTIEDQKSMFAKISRITKKNNNLSITNIQVNQDGTNTKLTNKQDIEQAIINEN
jgi:hypothetical protein